MYSHLAKLLRRIDIASNGSRHCSTNSPLRKLAQDGQIGKGSGVFSKIQMTPQPPPDIPKTAGSKSKWTGTLSVIGNTLFFGTLGVSGCLGYFTYMHDPESVKELIEARRASPFFGSSVLCSIMDFYLEKRLYLSGEIDRFSKPRQDNLLPDQLDPSRKTLVLDLDEVLVHSDWTRERGWKVLKRPGLEAFVKVIIFLESGHACSSYMSFAP